MMPNLTVRDIPHTLALAVTLAFSLSCLIIALLNPIDNWDMLGYAASVKSLYGMDAATIHASVYADYKAYASTLSFTQLTTDSSYRQVMYQDVDAFNQQIPYYKIRIVFVLLLAAISAMGIDFFSAMHLLTALFGAAAYLVIYLGMRTKIHPLAWMATPVCYYLFSLEFSIFQKAAVDSFAFFWVALTVVAFVRNSKWLYPLLALSVLVRTDLILHSALLFAASLYWNRTDWHRIVGWGVIALVAYTSVNSWAGNYGWTTLINFVFVSNMLATHPEQYSQHGLPFSQYLSFVFSKYDWISHWFWAAVIIAVINLTIYIATFRSSFLQQKVAEDQLQTLRRLQIISTLCLIYIALHYLLFPAIFMRFFYGQCFLFALSLIAAITAYATSSMEETARRPPMATDSSQSKRKISDELYPH